jgi:putative ABC transport system permease protein
MALSPLDLLMSTTKDLSGNLVRSGLTTLGIFMGVAAVNATLNINDISRTQIEQKLAARDNPYVFTRIFNPAGGSFRPVQDLPTEDDLSAMQREIADILSISRVARIFVRSGVHHEGKVADDAEISGVSENYQRTTGRRIVRGRFFELNDFKEYLPVAIIDQALVDQFFQDADPIGQGIDVGGTRFTIVGVTETKESLYSDKPTGEVWVTTNYGNALSGGYIFQTAQIALRQLDRYQSAQEQIEQFLSQRYPTLQVYVYGNAEDLYKEDQQQKSSSRILLVVGVLALVIGGVGIANITVASVMERTREIGLRRAIGATDLEVMAQFIMEAVILSIVGGVGAIATVHILTQTATATIFTDAPYSFQMENAALSMGAAFVVGVGASFLPALRITRIDVVDALRGE